jgi:hypothetical protein
VKTGIRERYSVVLDDLRPVASVADSADFLQKPSKKSLSPEVSLRGILDSFDDRYVHNWLKDDEFSAPMKIL